MRIRRLDLARYGKFTDHSIDFGERVAGGSDLHIVYGPNEAGKSTALSAFLDLLFGIEARSRYDFLHPYQTMRIGACLELADGMQELVRIKRPQRSLLGGDEQPVAEATMLGELGGIGREAYRTMFSLDDETLEAGGESILASKGDLGQLLFSASAGLAELSHTLVDLRSEADRFYKYRARNGELLQLKTSLAALKAEREEIDTFASDYAQLVEGRDRVSAQYREALAERGRVQARMDEIQRQLSALPRLVALRAVRERLQPLADIPEVPLGWTRELPGLQAQEIELATRADGIDREIGQISVGLEAIRSDPAALAIEGRVGRLVELGARHRAAEADMPECLLQAREQELAIAGLLARLGRSGDDPAGLMIGAVVVGTLRGLIETRSGIEAAIEAAGGELQEALHRRDAVRAGLRDAGGGAAAVQQMAALSTVAAVVRGSDHAVRRRLAERARSLHRETLADTMAGLHPWQGSAGQLAGMAVPDAGMLDRWKAALAEGQRQLERCREEIERLEGERVRLEAERTAMQDIVGDQDAGGLRVEREAAWANHRRLLDPASADAFEATLRRDDIATNARLRHEKESLAWNKALQGLVIVEADLGRMREKRDAMDGRLQSVRREIAGCLRGMADALPEDIDVAQLEGWIGRRGRVMEVLATLRRAEHDLQDAEADAGEARERLAAALDAAGVAYPQAAGFEALLAAAEFAMDRELELKALRAAVETAAQEVTTRERALEKASGADRSWQAAWAGACSACWLGAMSVVPGVAAVREILGLLAELNPAVERQAGLAGRVAKMQGEQSAFREEVEAVARLVGLEGGTAAELALRIGERVRQAQAARSAIASGQESLDGAHERQRVVREGLALHGRRRAEMTAWFGVGTLLEVGGRLQASARKAELQEQALAAERELLDAVRLSSVEAAVMQLDTVDREAIEREAAELRARSEGLDERLRELYAMLGRASERVDAVGGDDAVARIETRRRTILLEVEEKAVGYLKLRMGIVAAEQALRLYRDKHRSSMLARASDALRSISRGAYSGLATQPEKEGDTLIAVAANGASKLASDLSKGTRFQLYLALRVAGYHEFARARRPVPFIADDIMETFDDGRAEQALLLLGDMAHVGQVIYLTHHAHLCDIARRVLPDVRVHGLA